MSKNLTIVSCNLLQKIENQGYFQTHFIKLVLLWYQNKNRVHKRKILMNILNKYTWKKYLGKISKSISSTYINNYIPWSSKAYSSDTILVKHSDINQIIFHKNILMKKNTTWWNYSLKNKHLRNFKTDSW